MVLCLASKGYVALAKYVFSDGGLLGMDEDYIIIVIGPTSYSTIQLSNQLGREGSDRD